MRWRRLAWCTLAYGALLSVLYARALDAPYWHDDFIWLYWGTRLSSPLDLFVPHHFTYFVRPVAMAWFVALAPLAAFHPWVARLASIALIALSAALLHALVERTCGRAAGGWAAGLIFVTAAHHWELICGTAAVGDVLVGCFACAALCLHLNEEGEPWRVWGAASMAALAVMSKESGLVVPLLITLDDALLCRAGTARWRRLLPSWAMAGSALALELLAVGRRLDVPARPTLSTVLSDAPRMVVSTFLPTAAPPPGAMAWAGLVLLCSLALLGMGKRPALTLFLGWAIVGWLPYLLLAPAQLDQDRYAYLASFGAAGALGVALSEARGRPARGAAALLCVVFVAWNVACQQDYTQRLVAWLEPRRAIAAQVDPIASRLSARVPVYVYAHPEGWNEPAYALALYGGLSPDRMHDWYEALDAPSGGVFIHWDDDAHVLTDVTRSVKVGRAPQAVLVCDFDDPTARAGWRSGEIDVAALPDCDTDGHAVLEGPAMRVDPWSLWCVEVDYDASQVPPGANIRLAWKAEGDGSADLWHTTAAALHAGGGTVRLFPSTRARFWTDGPITRIYLQPSDLPARLRLHAVRLVPPPEARYRRRF